MAMQDDLRQDTLRFLDELQRSSSRTLKFPREVGLLLEASAGTDNHDRFEEIVFLAKFLTKTYEIMQRIGPDGEGYDKLSREFQQSGEKVSAAVQDILTTVPENLRVHFTQSFLTMDPQSFAQYLDLLSDLTVIKNWMLDGNPLPAAGGQS